MDLSSLTTAPKGLTIKAVGGVCLDSLTEIAAGVRLSGDRFWWGSQWYEDARALRKVLRHRWLRRALARLAHWLFG